MSYHSDAAMSKLREGNALSRALFSGTAASLAVIAAAAVLGRRTVGSAAAPINATSHILWGDEAARAQDNVSMRFTGWGFVLNHVSGIFWAAFFERLLGHKPSGRRVVASAAAVTATAYLTDYHLVPKRLTPGWELRLPMCSLGWVYATLGLSLIGAGLLRSSVGRLKS